MIDNLLEAEVLLPDGSVVTANKDRNPNLFRAHSVGMVCACPILWELARRPL